MVAVLVGIDGYKGERPLRCATHDAVGLSEVFKKVWRGRPLQLSVLVWPGQDEQCEGHREKLRQAWGIEPPKDARAVTKKGILSAIAAAAAGAQPEDTLLFYFAGHGCLMEGQPCLTVIGDANTGDGVDFLALRDVLQGAAGCASSKRVMILDCCQVSRDVSQGFFESLRGLGDGWSILLSCSPGEQSLEDVVSETADADFLEQGLFTASLMRGLRGEASLTGDESVSLMELAAFVCQRVQVECKERVKEGSIQVMLARRGSAPGAPVPSLEFQHPVLLAGVSAIGGPLQVVMAPVTARSKQDLRRRWPSRAFPSYVRRFLFGPWPVAFSRKHMFREGGALLYAATLTLTMMWFFSRCSGGMDWVASLGAGLGGAVLWWLMPGFAVAANEDGWLEGGYVVGIVPLLWHGVILALFFRWLDSVGVDFMSKTQIMTALGIHLSLIYVLVLVFGCNASGALIALAEPLRTDGRREIREAITAFRQFRSRAWNVDLFNLVAMVSVRPSLYFYGLGFAALILGAHTAYAVRMYLSDPALWMVLMRNAFALALIAWNVFWYNSAFLFLQREVYKR